MKGSNPAKVELLAPAGNVEKMEIAVHYGADAVYLAGKDFSLRNFSGNFSPEEMRAAIAYGHARGVKIYVACNIYPRDGEIPAIREHLAEVGRLGPDGVIVADPGIFRLARESKKSLCNEVTIITNRSNHIPMFTTIDNTNVAARFVRIFLNQNS